MSEIVFPQAVVPTTSLFFIEELFGDKLDGYIYELKATSATESRKPKEEMPHKWALVEVYATPRLFINYSYRRCLDEPFSLPLAVELARKYDIGECWVKKLTLHINDPVFGNNLYTFVNRPLTRGSQAERYVFNRYAKYLKRRRMTGWIKTIPRRHLPMVKATVFPRRSLLLDWKVVHYSKFIAWLNRVTHGLVVRKIVRRTVGDRFVDIKIEEG